jgi:predicted CXXCH cytochrome family protein
MSPGYDRPDNLGFLRAIGESCLECHAGRVEVVGKSQHRYRIQEAAIGCERCHGPGSLHVAALTADPPDGAEPPRGLDDTIVNPSHLPRELAEAVCQQCHLHGAATVQVRGRGPQDYRPGLPLQEYRLDYQLEADSTPLTVVGHVEQMHFSRCYKESAGLTCTTCHDPHAFPRPEERVAYYRDACLRCHSSRQCTVGDERRRRESPDNDCVRCHMPAAPTEVQHVAFTHHRIAIYDGPPPARAEGAGPGRLRPILDDAAFGAPDRKRSLGLAYLILARNEKQPAAAAHYRGQALELLSAVQAEGLPDPVLEANLARLLFEKGEPRALALAEQALAHPEITGLERCTALFVVAGECLRREQYGQALRALRELVTLRRHPDDWLLLAQCTSALGDEAAAVEALETAVRYNPRLVQVHQQLAQHYRQRGDLQRAAWHQQRAVP